MNTKAVRTNVIVGRALLPAGSAGSGLPELQCTIIDDGGGDGDNDVHDDEDEIVLGY